MLSSLVKRGKVAAAVEVFNAHLSSGGTTGAVPFNILMSGFAAQGELTNAEALMLQMRSMGVRPDTYTLNALLRACGARRRPYRALAHLRILTKGGAQACRADAASLTLLSGCLGPPGLGMRALKEARYAARAGAALDLRSRAMLLRACSGVAPQEGGAAREGALWLWAEGGATVLSGQCYDDACVLAMMRVLARAGDLDGARQVFESQPPPHSAAAWGEMLRLEQDHGRSGLVLAELGVEVDEEGVAVTAGGKLGTLRPPGWAEDAGRLSEGVPLPTVSTAGMEAALRGAQESLRRGEAAEAEAEAAEAAEARAEDCENQTDCSV